MNPATIAKALKLNALRKDFEPRAMKIFEQIQTKEDGTAVYVVQMLFRTEAEAKAFKEFASISSELERMLNE